MQDRRKIRRAIPAVILCRRHGRWIAAGKLVLGLDQGADLDLADLALQSGPRLHQPQGGENLVVLGASGGQDAFHNERKFLFAGGRSRLRILGRQAYGIPQSEAQRFSQRTADPANVPLGIGHGIPNRFAFQFPCGIELLDAGLKPIARRGDNRMLPPGSDQNGGMARGLTLDADRHVQVRGKGDDVVPPEDFFQLGERRFLNIGAFRHGAIINAADLNRQRIRRWGDYNVGPQGSQFPAHLVADIERHMQHGGGNGCSQGDRQHGPQGAAAAAGPQE